MTETGPSSFRAIIELWPSREAMASDLREIDPEASAASVSKWWQRDNIPSDWWFAVLRTGKAAAAGVSSDVLTRLAAREPAEARA